MIFNKKTICSENSVPAGIRKGLFAEDGVQVSLPLFDKDLYRFAVGAAASGLQMPIL
jgi:hypothetical protein